MPYVLKQENLIEHVFLRKERCLLNVQDAGNILLHLHIQAEQAVLSLIMHLCSNNYICHFNKFLYHFSFNIYQ